MKSFIFAVVSLFLISEKTFPQDYQSRMQSLLAQIDAEEVHHQINLITTKVGSDLSLRRLLSVAILPFRDAQNRRTGLAEYLAAEIGKKLARQEMLEVTAADQTASILRNETSLAAIRWPQDGAAIAAALGVSALLRGRIIDGAGEFVLVIDIYSVAKKQVVGTHRANLPRTAGLIRLMELVLDENTTTKADAPPALPETPTTEKPRIEPAPSPSVPSTTVAAALEVAVRNLADKLAARLMEAKQFKVGVLEFLDLQGRISQLGKFMAEDLTTAFFEKGKFLLVERGLLHQVMREHALTQTGIIDITQAQEIGKAVGADAIITGSLSDIGDEIKANARLIDVRAGTVLAVAGESIAKTENVAKMFNTFLWSPGGKTTPLPQPPTLTTTPSASVGYVFFEDFQNVQEGMLPEGWLGGEKLMVKSDGRQKFVTDFERQESHKVLIDNVAFPENFEFTTVFQFGNQAYGTHLIAYLGSLTMTIDVYGWYKLNNTLVEKHIDWRNKVVKAVLTKEGPIFKLLINGEEVLLMRDTNYKLPQAVSLEIRNQSGFKLMQVGLRAL
ncbi:MAG: CsgG/HfaB family protein [candidate division KSB1 bacterium]|nr:CsgG/HfaB family protein [candidate division KSB1 bacterium]MDZ7304478.1 CsgG/HfaB family protein [candidate division KSB1 bacterium]MDZ7312985.1 CsgG/HfaB family protein [candidate division KSB1 bacterium]